MATKTKRTKAKPGRKIKPVEMWAWAIKDFRGTGWVLCKWAEPSSDCLTRLKLKPSPEAKAVKVICSVYGKEH